MNAPLRPVLRFHGGKWKIAPWVISHFPPHRVYVEPFAGGASVLLRKPRSVSEIYNDLDGDVVNVFRVLRDPAQAARLAEILYLTPYSRDEFIAAYEQTEDPIERARRLIVRSHCGNGSIGATRPARSGFNFRLNGIEGRVSQCGVLARLPHYVAAFARRLRHVVIENRPAVKIIDEYDRADALIYCDPPYLRETRSSGSRSYKHEMKDEDHEELAARLQASTAMIVVSGYASKKYERWFSGWRRDETSAMAHGAKPRTEVVWFNPACAAALERSRAQAILL